MVGAIENRSNRLVSIRLNTGQTRHIPPGGSLSGIMEVEVKHNAMVRKLIDRRIIALHDFSVGPRSIDMKADEAIAHLQNTPLKALKAFVPAEEHRTTVLRAWEEKQKG